MFIFCLFFQGSSARESHSRVMWSWSIRGSKFSATGESLDLWSNLGMCTRCEKWRPLSFLKKKTSEFSAVAAAVVTDVVLAAFVAVVVAVAIAVAVVSVAVVAAAVRFLTAVLPFLVLCCCCLILS